MAWSARKKLKSAAASIGRVERGAVTKCGGQFSPQGCVISTGSNKLTELPSGRARAADQMMMRVPVNAAIRCRRRPPQRRSIPTPRAERMPLPRCESTSPFVRGSKGSRGKRGEARKPHPLSRHWITVLPTKVLFSRLPGCLLLIKLEAGRRLEGVLGRIDRQIPGAILHFRLHGVGCYRNVFLAGSKETTDANY